MLQDALLFITLLVLPFQLGKHFWPSFAFVSGQRVDYLSPTFYISDILIILLCICAIACSFKFKYQILKPKTNLRPKSIREQKKFDYFLSKTFGIVSNLVLRISNLKTLVLFGGVLYLVIGIFFSQNPLSGWYSLLKFFELFFFGWVVARSGKILPTLLFWSFCIGVFLEGILGLLQFLHQASLNGVWYFLGERAFSAATPGIANATIHGQLILRPYATFPHPNVFAGYLVISLLFLLTFLFATKITWQRIVSIFVGIFGFGVLLLTLSRVAIIVFILLATIFIFTKLKNKIYLFLVTTCCILLATVLGGSFLLGRFFDPASYQESIFQRDMLMQSAWWMSVSHPLLGVGLGNFLPSLPFYLPSKILFGFLQPVHNIFLLVLAETGIVGLGIFIWILALAFKNNIMVIRSLFFVHGKFTNNHEQITVNQNKILSQFALFSLIAICLIGMTDHYFLTLQQGQLLFALILGISMQKAE